VIGDELCAGTESTSAISLVGGGIMWLSEKQVSFIFASHLHEICDLECVKKLDNVNIYHLSVIYDNVKNHLVFERKLQPGNGNVLYGFEIAKSLDLPLEFLSTTNSIRQDILNINKDIVRHKTSSYSSDVYMDLCSICNNECTEVHHITEQKYADINGMLLEEQISKNRKSNLMTVCELCHNKIHSNFSEKLSYKQTSEGIKLETREMKEMKEKKEEGSPLHNIHNIKNIKNIKNICIEMRKSGNSYTKILEYVKKNYDEDISMYRIKKIINKDI
jgi:DNA mismatch repair protein MutS